MSNTAIICYGRFGRALGGLLLDLGRPVAAWDPAAGLPEAVKSASAAEAVSGAEAVVLAVPVEKVSAVLRSLRPHLTAAHLVLDVGSVKAGPVAAMRDILSADIPWAATHPLFGPSSVARGERPLRAVVCPNDMHTAAAARAAAFYEGIGCKVLSQSAEEHDRLMAATHAMAFFVAKGMLDAGVEEALPFAPPSFQAMAQTIREVRADAGHLFFPIESGNPFAAGAREELLDALTRIHRELAEARPASLPAPESLTIPSSPEPAPELKETRELIDELDAQIVQLLARRTRLSRHAARVKAAQGAPVQDPARERALLASRKKQAAEWDLAPETVAEVFEAILRFSRAEQRRWLEGRG